MFLSDKICLKVLWIILSSTISELSFNSSLTRDQPSHTPSPLMGPGFHLNATLQQVSVTQLTGCVNGRSFHEAIMSKTRWRAFCLLCLSLFKFTLHLKAITLKVNLHRDLGEENLQAERS